MIWTRIPPLLSLSASDTDGDSLTFTAASNGNALTASVTGTTLTLTSSEVTEDTNVEITVTVSDGQDEDTASFVTTIINVPQNTAPTIEVDTAFLQLAIGETQSVFAVINDAEDGTTLTSNIDISDAAVVSVTQTSSGFDVSAINEGNSVISYTVTDSGGLTATAQVSVEVQADENEPPSFTLNGEQEGNVYQIYHDRESVINVNIIDADSDSHYLSMTRFEATAGTVDVINQYEVNNDNKTIRFDIAALPINLDTMQFEMELQVTDDSDNITTKIYQLVVEKSANSTPLFTFSNTQDAFVLIDQDATTEITYTIDDDDVSKVDVTGVEYWYGDEAKFDIQLDSQNNLFTVTTDGVDIGDTFGFVLKYEDVSLAGTVNIELFVTAPFGEVEQQMRDLKNNMLKAREAVKEYVYVAEFYAQVLENKGYLTRQQAEDFVQAVNVDDTENGEYTTFNLYISLIETYISGGDFQDEGFTGSYITVLNNLFENAQMFSHQRYAIINDMIATYPNVLPQVTFEDEIVEYDTDNHYYSRFVGKDAYGEMVDGVWVFSEQFSFMNALLLNMNENAQKYIDQ